jgi:hypothetical protein
MGGYKSPLKWHEQPDVTFGLAIGGIVAAVIVTGLTIIGVVITLGVGG